MAKKNAGAPAVVLIASGVIGLVYAIVSFVWTLIPVAWGLMVVLVNVSEKGFSGETVSGSLLFLSMPLLQTPLFAFTVVTGAITLFAGIRFRQWRSKGLVWLGLICSTATPVLGAVGNSASLFNCGAAGAGVFGCLFGNATTIPVFVIGLVASIWGAAVMFSDAAHNFEES